VCVKFNTCGRTIALAGLIFIGLMPESRGQSPAESKPKFAVAVVKPTNLDLRQRIDMRVLPDGGLTATNVTLQFLIKVAYGVQDSQVSGGPGWINTEKFDILAKPAEGTKPPLLPMLQSLLEDRFKLVIRRSTKSVAVYELKMARADRLGPGLHELEAGTCPTGPRPVGGPAAAPCGGFLSARNQLTGRRVTMTALTSPLSTILQRPVLDKTGRGGQFDLELYWTPDETVAGRGDLMPVPGDASPTSIFTAIQEQLGLRLESARGSVEIVEIVGAEKPGEN
jgi:uncharacterized protein (TIGR03435 family)